MKISSDNNQYMVWVLFIKAEIYEKIGDINKAKNYYEKVVDLFPGTSLSLIAEKILSKTHNKNLHQIIIYGRNGVRRIRF